MIEQSSPNELYRAHDDYPREYQLKPENCSPKGPTVNGRNLRLP